MTAIEIGGKPRDEGPLCAIEVFHAPEPTDDPERLGQYIDTLANGRFAEGRGIDKTAEDLMAWGKDHGFRLNPDEVRARITNVANHPADCQTNRPCPDDYCDKEACGWPPAALVGPWFDSGKVPEVSSQTISEKARAIAEHGDPLRYLIWQAQLNHIGDIGYQKVLICSIASTASLTGKGIQPSGHGDKGSGKTSACKAVYHLIPRDRVMEGSLSPMSLFYMAQEGRLRDGMVLFSDDIEYDYIRPLFKRSASSFQAPVRHYTVLGGKEKRAAVLEIPPRFSWWLTSVEAVADEQTFDRQYPCSTDSSPSHKKQVADEIASRRSRKETGWDEDEGVQVAREILADIYDNGPFKVLIPQAEGAEWVRPQDFRGQDQFWDLVDALTILRWRQRRMEDGYLIADDADIWDALEITKAHKIAHNLDLTEAETRVVGALMDGLPKTQKELTEALGISQSTLSERLRSILSKSPTITEDQRDGRKYYQINGKVDLSTQYWEGVELIRFKTAIKKPIGQLSVCYRYVIGVPIGIIINNSNRIPYTISAQIGGVSMEQILAGRDPSQTPPIRSSGKKPITDRNREQEPQMGTDKIPGRPTDKTDKCSNDSDHRTDKSHRCGFHDLQQILNTAGKGGEQIVYRLSVSSVPLIQDNPSCQSVSEHDRLSCIGDTEGTNGTLATHGTDGPDLKQIRLLSPVLRFRGTDNLDYGPFDCGDVASMPSIHAMNLVQRGLAIPINPDPGLWAGVVK